MLRRRALTLIELLIAVAVMAAMTAIVVPNLLGRLDERRFISAVDILTQQLLLARAHAQVTGDVVEVRWVIDEQNANDGSILQSHLDARLLRLQMPDDITGNGANGLPIDRPEFGSTIDEVDEDEDVIIYEPWARQPLPSGVWLTDQQPAGLGQGAFAELNDGAKSLEPFGVQDVAPRVIRLAVFLPDGSALVGDTRWLVDDDERVAEMSISHWTGLPNVQRLEPGNGGSRADEQPDDAVDDFQDQPDESDQSNTEMPADDDQDESSS